MTTWIAMQASMSAAAAIRLARSSQATARTMRRRPSSAAPPADSVAIAYLTCASTSSMMSGPIDTLNCS